MSYAILHTDEEEIVKVVQNLIQEIKAQLPQNKGQSLKLKDFKQSDEILKKLNDSDFQFLLVILDEKIISDLEHRRSLELFNKISEYVLSGSREKCCVLFIKYQISENDEAFEDFKADLKGEPHIVEFTSYEEVARYSAKCMVEREATESSELDANQRSLQLNEQQQCRSFNQQQYPQWNQQQYFPIQRPQLDPQYLQQPQYPFHLHPVNPAMNQFVPHPAQQPWQQVVQPPLHQLANRQLQQNWNPLSLTSLQDNTGTMSVQSCQIPQTVRDIMAVESLSLQDQAEPIENSLHSNSSASDVQLKGFGGLGPGAFRNELQTPKPCQDSMPDVQAKSSGPGSGTFRNELPTLRPFQDRMPPQSGLRFPPNVQIVDPSMLPVRFQYPANVNQPNQQGGFHYPANATNVTNTPSFRPVIDLLSYDSNQFNSAEGNLKDNQSMQQYPPTQRNVTELNKIPSAKAEKGLMKSSCNSKEEKNINNIGPKNSPRTLEADGEAILSKGDNPSAEGNPDSNLTGNSFLSSYIHGGLGNPGLCVNCMQFTDCLPVRAPEPSFNSGIPSFNVSFPTFTTSSNSGPQAMPCVSGLGYCSKCLQLFDQSVSNSQQFNLPDKSSGNSQSTDLNEILNTEVREAMINSLKKDRDQNQAGSSQQQTQPNLPANIQRSGSRSVPLSNLQVQNQQRPYSSLTQATAPQGLPLQNIGGLSLQNNGSTNDMNRNLTQLMYTRDMIYNISGTGSYVNSGESETDNTRAPVSTKQTQTDRHERPQVNSECGTSGDDGLIPQNSGFDGASSVDSGSVAGATGGSDVNDRSIWDLPKSVLTYIRDTLDLSSVHNWQDIADQHGWSYGRIHQLKTRWERRQIESPFLELLAHFHSYTVGDLKEDLEKITRNDVLNRLRKLESNNELFN